MTTLLITRHGQTLWNLEGRLQGHMDSDLTDLGKNQAAWLGERLRDVEIHKIYASSSGRTLKTAEIIRGKRNIEIIASDQLREINMGSWEGQFHSDIEAYDQEAYYNFWHKPDLYQPQEGESYESLLTRVTNEVEKIIGENENKTILIVTHAGVLKSLMVYFKNMAIKDFWSGPFMKSACLNIIEISGDHKKLVLEGDISHYPKER